VADVLFGTAPATGTLPVTWEQSASQEPINVGDGKTGLFAFGAGLGLARTQPARNVIGAAYYSGQSGTSVEICTDAGCGQDVGSNAPGDYLWYDDVDFGTTSPTSVTTRIASGATVTGTLQYRLDSVTGPVVASLATGTTGGWQSWTSQVSTLSSTVTGTHRLYLVFSGTSVGDLANVNWFQFQ